MQVIFIDLEPQNLSVSLSLSQCAASSRTVKQACPLLVLSREAKKYNPSLTPKRVSARA